MAPKKKQTLAKANQVEDVGGDDPDFQVSQEVIQKLMAGGNAELIAAMQQGLMGLMGSSSGYIESLPAPVKTRVEYLQELQEKYDEYEQQMHEEIKAIEEKYTKLTDPLLEKRQSVVSGATEAPANQTAEGKKAIKEAGDDVPKGIPEFWSVALRAHPDIDQMVTEKDSEVLAYLSNITSETLKDEDDDDAGFKLIFSFNENPFFSNKQLTLTYNIDKMSDDAGVTSIIGCKINWKGDKDVTVKKLVKKPKAGSKAKPQVKTEPVESFFRLFTDTPEIPSPEEAQELEEEELEALQEAVEHHLGIGEIIHEGIIPNAINWFTGDAVTELYGGDDDDEDDEVDYGSDEDDDEDDDDEEEDSEDDDDGDDDGKPPKDSKEQPQECKQQ